jgi:tRNA dimethylallyltransferase
MSKQKLPKLIVILGPTATGKTKLAVALARKFNGEIVSADSRQVYRGMDIGTGKDLSEYKLTTNDKQQTTKNIPYHLIDICNPNTEFNVVKYKKLALKEINEIVKRGKTPFLVGGTGLYISAIVDNLDFPAVAPSKKIRKKLEKLKKEAKIKLLKKLDSAALEFVDINNPRRLDRALEVCLAGYKFSELRKKKEPIFDCLQLGVTFPKKIIDKRIDTRVELMIKNGLIMETEKLIKKYGKKAAPLQTIGYKEIIDFLKNKPGQKIGPETINLIKIHTHQFAKRQMTWFKRDKKIKWIRNEKQATGLIKKFIK